MKGTVEIESQWTVFLWGVSYPMECGWRQANGHRFPPKPQKTRLGWGTNHEGDPKMEDLAGPPACTPYQRVATPSIPQVDRGLGGRARTPSSNSLVSEFCRVSDLSRRCLQTIIYFHRTIKGGWRKPDDSEINGRPRSGSLELGRHKL